jgi:hypothetical protein
MPVSLAVDRVIVNSADWHDVYSGMLYASIEKLPSNFLVSQKHGAILLYSIPTTEKNLLVASSRTQPYVFSYAPFLQSKGYDNATELVSRNLNLDLARRLATTKFIVIDPAYGYNAISAAPYAALSGTYVLFADRRTIDEVSAFLQERGVTSLIVFGQVDRQVKDALAQFSPETVNEGDRFGNNLAMVERYQQLKVATTGQPSRQVILTNGEFIESGIMAGSDPVVYIGKSNVPDNVREYIQKSDIQVGILIGNELIGTATFIRRQLGISVFVKFAQGARTPKGAIAQVEDLDRFPMPSYAVALELTSLVYNKATRALEVTYRNPTELALYLKGTITISGGTNTITTGDATALFLDKGESKTIVYSTDTDGQPLLLDGTNLTADVFTIFGEGTKSLDNSLQASMKVGQVEIADDALVNITGLYYDKSAQKFYVTIENVGPVDAYVQPEILDLMVNDAPVTVASDAVALIRKGKSAKVPVSVAMEEADFLANPQVKVRAYYGEREIALVKVTEATFPLTFGGGYTQYLIYAGVGLVVLLILFFLGTKKKCKHCGHKNARGRKTCEKCGQKI